MNDEHPDINDTLRSEGPEAVRSRHDRAHKYPGNGQGKSSDKRQRFRLIPFRELTPKTSSNYLVQGIIPRDGIIAVWGPPKCGKSLWAFDVAMHSALGWDYGKRRVISGLPSKALMGSRLAQRHSANTTVLNRMPKSHST
jgi:hypothetical protein